MRAMPQGSVLGRSTVVRGNVRGTGALEIFGRVEGDVSITGELVIGEDGAVKGDVTGGYVTISGAVQGDVRATEAVMLESGARVVGDFEPLVVLSYAGMPDDVARNSLRLFGEKVIPAIRELQLAPAGV